MVFSDNSRPHRAGARRKCRGQGLKIKKRRRDSLRRLKVDVTFQYTGAIPEGSAKMKPRTPMMSGDLPARKS